VLDGHDAPVEVAREREVAVELLVREHVVLREPVRCGGRVHLVRVRARARARDSARARATVRGRVRGRVRV